MSVLDQSEVQRFLDEDPDAPVVMLNLVKFAPDGATKYAEYFERLVSSGVKDRYGVTIVYGGTGHAPLAGADDGNWDQVVLVRYPSRRNFVDMVHDPDYLAIEHLRSEAVAVAVLQPTTPVDEV